MPSAERVFKSLSGDVQSHLESNDVPSESWLAHRIYNALTVRDDPARLDGLYRRHYAKRADDYVRLFFSPESEEFPEREWHNVIFFTEVPRKHRSVGSSTVYFKRYFTFKPTAGTPAAGVWSDIRKFVGMLPKLESNLRNIDPEGKSIVQFKVPGNLRMLVTHPDSLVVHFTDPAMGERIKRVVEKTARESGVEFGDRGFRAERGFDLKEDDGVRTHSDLVAKVMAREIAQNKASLGGYGEAQLADWLKERIVDVSAWTPQRVHSVLSGP